MIGKLYWANNFGIHFHINLFMYALKNIKTLQWSRQTFSTCEEKLFYLHNKYFNLYINNNENSVGTMKQECDKPIKKLNFNQLLKRKEKVQFEIVEKPMGKKPRSKVDLKLMTEELKQLQDPPTTPWEKQISSGRLTQSFFNVDCKSLAKNLLGKILVRKLDNGVILKGRIVETESYLGIEDKASHTYDGKVTPKNIPMYMPAGTIYVYFTYGMYHCFNISGHEEGSAVLIRSLEPLEGIEQMTENRRWKPNAKKQIKLSKELKLHELCNGPSKMCIAMKLEKKHSKYSVCDWKGLWIEDDKMQDNIKIVECPRIGIESAGKEWANKPLRYYMYNHKCVSKRNKEAESIFLLQN